VGLRNGSHDSSVVWDVGFGNGVLELFSNVHASGQQSVKLTTDDRWDI
jgi:hypothetical protein